MWEQNRTHFKTHTIIILIIIIAYSGLWNVFQGKQSLTNNVCLPFIKTYDDDTILKYMQIVVCTYIAIVPIIRIQQQQQQQRQQERQRWWRDPKTKKTKKLQSKRTRRIRSKRRERNIYIYKKNISCRLSHGFLRFRIPGF